MSDRPPQHAFEDPSEKERLTEAWNHLQTLIAGRREQVDSNLSNQLAVYQIEAKTHGHDDQWVSDRIEEYRQQQASDLTLSTHSWT